jgi:hypothetical protein
MNIKTSLLVVVVVVFIAAYSGLFVTYQGKVEEKKNLEDEIDSATTLLIATNSGAASTSEEIALLEEAIAAQKSQLEELQSQIPQKETEIASLEAQRQKDILDAEALLEKTRLKFPLTQDALTTDLYLYELARLSGVKVTAFSTGQVSGKDIGETQLLAPAFSLTVEGDVPALLKFIELISSDELFETSIITPVNLVIPEEIPPETVEGWRSEVRDEMLKQAEEQVRESLTSKDLAEITRKAVTDFLNISVSGISPEERASYITQELIPRFGPDVARALGDAIANLIEEDIVELLGPRVAQDIGGFIAGLLADDIAKLLGANTALYIEDDVAAGLEGAIVSYISEGIASLVQERTDELVSELAVELVSDEVVEEVVAQRLAEQTVPPSATIDLSIYSYGGA